MAKKQILNHVFQDLPNGKVKIIYPDNFTDIRSKDRAEGIYRLLYAQKNADKLCEQVIKELGYTKNNIHLTTYDVKRIFRDKLERLLRQNNIDVSFDSVITNDWGIKISGNASGIASSYITELWSKPWYEVKMTHDEIVKYLKKNKNIKLYKSVRFGIEEVKTNKFDFIKNISFGTKSNTIGIGSCSSVNVETITLKRDKQGNLLIDHSILKYD